MDIENHDSSEQDSGHEDRAASGGQGPGAAPDRGSGAASGDGRGIVQRIKDVWANPAHRFVLLFLPYLGVVSVGYPYVVKNYNQVIQAFILATAQMEYWFFLPFTSRIRVDEKLVFLDGFAVKIIDECTGIYEMLIFASAVLAFPTSWRKKLIGIGFGCPMIYVFNVLRIAMLMVVGRYYPAAFDFMHLYFWQATMIVMITSVWLLWIMKVVRSGEEPAPAPA